MKFLNFTWDKKWKSVLVWLCAYLNFIAFVLVGGYFHVKGEDERVETATKHAFLVTLLFAGINAFFLLFHNIGSLANSYYSSWAYDFYTVCTSLVQVAKVITYVVFVVLALVKKDKPEAPALPESTENE